MLRKFLQANYEVVDKPDHPYIISGPDFLINDENDLSALFIQPENYSFELIYRIIAARLVYPVDTKMILVHVSDDPIFSPYAKYCDKILIKQRGLDFNIIQSRSRQKSNNRYKKLRNLQRILFKRQMDFFDANMEYLEKNNRKNQELIPAIIEDNRFSKKEFNNIIEQKEYKADELYIFNGKMFVQKKISGKKREIFEVEKLRVYSIANEFYFDEGWPIQAEIKEKFLNINRLPNSGFDPLRIVRVLSFYGWSIRMVNTVSQLQKEMK